MHGNTNEERRLWFLSKTIMGRQDLTPADKQRRLALTMLGMWIVSMLILRYDALNLDWATLVTVGIAIFGAFMNASIMNVRTAQGLQDTNSVLSEVKEDVRELRNYIMGRKKE